MRFSLRTLILGLVVIAALICNCIASWYLDDIIAWTNSL